MGPFLLIEALNFTSLVGQSRTDLRGAVSQTQTVIGCTGTHLETMRGCIPAVKKNELVQRYVVVVGERGLVPNLDT